VIPEHQLPPDQFEFLQAVWSRRTPFSFIFLGINLAIFVLMALAGGSTNEATLMAFGVKSNPEIAEGQWWRFVTPVFIHIGLLHLFFNSYALWMVGPQVEKLYGSARFVILYVMTGVAGVLGSYYYHPETVSAGASGAIFGLFGVLLVFGVRYRNSIPPEFKRAVGTGVLPVIAINLFIGFTIPQIDNSAHIAGLLGGAGLAALLPFQRPGEETNRFYEGVQFALLVLVAVCFYQVAAHYDGPRLSARNLTRGFTQIFGTSSTTGDFIAAINNAQNTFEASARDLRSANTGGLAETKSSVGKSIDELRSIPSLAVRSDELADQLLKVMQDQYELIEEVERSGTMNLAHNLQLKENVGRYENVMAEFSRWVASEGRRYGIQPGKGQ
jgi:rhomboid protease GluP